jgi:hypothetical protein
LEDDPSRELLRWRARLRLRSGGSAAAAIGARIGAMIAGTDGRGILRFIHHGGSGASRGLETSV